MSLNNSESNIPISVIIPVYNVEDFIEKALNSVVKQTMKNYEVMFIVKPNLEDEATNAVCENMKKVLENMGANIKDVKNMGRRELAYEVKKYTKAYYVVVDTTTTPANVAEFDRLSRINQNVLRHLTIKR